MPPQVYAANTPILRTGYHVQDIVQQPLATEFNGCYQIDFTKPGAQEYENSIVQLFADWGFDYLKFDGVRVGVSRSGFLIDDRPDVRATSLAITQAGRPMYLNLSSNLNHDYAAWWERWSNGRRIDGDIECSAAAGCTSTITEWSKVILRFTDLLPWPTDAGPYPGWNDLDSPEVGNGTNYSLTQRFITVDQSGHPGKVVTEGNTPIWAQTLSNGSYYGGLFNLNDQSSSVIVNWIDLGFSGPAESATSGRTATSAVLRIRSQSL